MLYPKKAEQSPLRIPFEDALLLPLEYLFCRGDLQSEDSIHILSSCLYLFFEALFQQLSPFLPSIPSRIAQKHNYAMLPEDIVDYIENRISRRVTAEETAQHFFMSTRHLNRRLLTTCGMTFGELSDRVRCDFAKQLLLHTDLSVEKIGEQVGFSDAGSFARFFKRMTDVPPSVFRKKREEQHHG